MCRDSHLQNFNFGDSHPIVQIRSYLLLFPKFLFFSLIFLSSLSSFLFYLFYSFHLFSRLFSFSFLVSLSSFLSKISKFQKYLFSQNFIHLISFSFFLHFQNLFLTFLDVITKLARKTLMTPGFITDVRKPPGL